MRIPLVFTARTIDHKAGAFSERTGPVWRHVIQGPVDGHHYSDDLHNKM